MSRRLITLMRSENPDVWRQIDVMRKAGARLGAAWRRIRFAVDRCTSCKYDLTGNVSGVCPECGKPIDETPAYRRMRSIEVLNWLCKQKPEIADAVRARQEAERRHRRDTEMEVEAQMRNARRVRAMESYLRNRRGG